MAVALPVATILASTSLAQASVVHTRSHRTRAASFRPAVSLRASAESGPQIFGADSKTPCIYPATNTDLLAQFSALTGKQFNCVLVYNNARPTWAWWTQLWVAHPPQPNMAVVTWKNAVPGRRLIISQPMVPDDAPANWRVLGAEGAYDQYAVQFAQNLVNLGLGDSIIRLGWEANAQADIESALGNDPSQYGDWAQYWDNIVTSMKSVPGAHFLFDWTINQYWEPIPLNEWYPGNNFVDIIGIDGYDSGVCNTSLSPSQRWATLSSETDGYNAIANFAAANGKPISIPEWGLSPTSSGCGAGDDPAYLEGLATFIATHDVAYESYFYQPGADGLLYLPDAPQSLSVYRQMFGSGMDLTTGTTASVGSGSTTAVVTVTSPTGTTVQATGGGTHTTSASLPAGSVAGVARVPHGVGSWVATRSGQVVAQGGARSYGSVRAGHLSGHITGITAAPSGRGYWLVSSTGRVYAFGSAHWYGNLAPSSARGRVSAIGADSSGHGYYIVTTGGRVFAFGDAVQQGDSTSRRIVGSVRSLSVTPSGRGYWLATTSGRVYAFGDARFAGQRVAPAGSVVAVVQAGSNRGYWLVSTNGTLAAFGSAPRIPGRSAGIQAAAAS